MEYIYIYRHTYIDIYCIYLFFKMHKSRMKRNTQNMFEKLLKIAKEA